MRDPLVQAFWKVWGCDQVAYKVFPSVMAQRNVKGLASIQYSTGANTSGIDCVSFTCIPIKEGLHNIIKCLRSQELNDKCKLIY